MKSALYCLLALHTCGVFSPVFSQTQAAITQTAPAIKLSCALPVEAISKAFGARFNEGKEIAHGHGKACRYEAAKFSIVVQATATAGGFSPDHIRKLSKPAGTYWVGVLKDADGAMIEKPKMGSPAVPAVSYERKGYYIELLAQGELGASVADTNAKLVKLPRIPN